MTKNQIAFLELQETKRANQAREAETYRSNKAQESLTAYRDTNAVQMRDREIAEIMRSNLAREAETQRSNIAREAESYRSNVAREVETQRHNKASEGADLIKARASAQQAAASISQASSAALNAQLRGQELALLDQYRNATLTQEQQKIRENYRSNVARETEQRRHNTAMERVDRTKLTQEGQRIGQEQQKIQQNQQRIDVEKFKAETQWKDTKSQIRHRNVQGVISIFNAAEGVLTK